MLCGDSPQARVWLGAGGALLNSVHKASARSGDAQARSVARFLLERAAVPYIRMLEKWIFYGVLEDPHGEFMVRTRVMPHG